MPRLRLPRLPFDDLATLADTHSLERAADAFGVDQRSIMRWRAEGVPLYAADAAACAVDLVPTLVWGDAWEEAEQLAEAMREEAAEARRLRGVERSRRRREERERARQQERDYEWREVLRSWWQWSEQQHRTQEEA